MCAGLTEDHVGKVVPLKFLEVDQAKNRLVVSNRRAMVETKLTNLEPGQLVQVCASFAPVFWSRHHVTVNTVWGVARGLVHACTCGVVSGGRCRWFGRGVLLSSRAVAGHQRQHLLPPSLLVPKSCAWPRVAL